MLLSRIEAFNAGRDPERLAMKYAAMRADSFAFLRGTAHLFYEDLNAGALPEAPQVWCCGDLHLQNFGAYKGDNRLVYFDLNDFDEACLAPATWDLVRFVANLIVAGKTLGMNRETVNRLIRVFLEGYGEALGNGKARWLERATSGGMVRKLLVGLKRRNRKRFLATRTEMVNGRRRLLLDGQRTLPLLPGERPTLQRLMKSFAACQANPSFYRLLDAARRIAGTGSLGLPRFVLLVEGRGRPGENFLLDLKYEPGSCLAARLNANQPQWATEAERVAVTQYDVQAVAPALLTTMHFDGKSWLLHELMPVSDRLAIENWHHDVDGFAAAVRTLGEIVAWGNLRAAGRRGAAPPEALIAFGRSRRWQAPLVAVGRESARRIEEQWRQFARTSAV
jgi:uncharacterized protein (DUF2252 family)